LIGIVCKKKTYGFCEQTLGLETTLIDRHTARGHKSAPRDYYVALLFFAAFFSYFVFRGSLSCVLLVFANNADFRSWHGCKVVTGGMVLTGKGARVYQVHNI
jgi:hypothetical protein